MKSKEIKVLLRQKHSNDVFYTEVKTGATMSARRGELGILDAWAARISWTNPCVTGYEIKVSRSDFIGDLKWRSYLKYTNAFYFVCPFGMIKPEELPPDVGLMYVTKNGKRLRTVQKAPHREQEIPQSILWYLLYYRASGLSDSAKTALYWEGFMQQAADRKALGRAASKKIQRDLKELRKAEQDSRVDEQTVAAAREICEKYKEITGHDIMSSYFKHVNTNKLRQKLNPLLALIPASLITGLRSIATHLEKLRKDITDEY